MTRQIVEIVKCALTFASVAMAIAALRLAIEKKQNVESEFCRPLQEWYCINDWMMNRFTRSKDKMGHALRCASYRDRQQILVALKMVLECHQPNGSRQNVHLTPPDKITLPSARFRMMSSLKMTGNTSIIMNFIEPTMSIATEHRRNVVLHQNDTIVILKSGMYHLYATIHFYQDPDKRCHFVTNPVSERVLEVLLTLADQQKKPLGILTVSHSCCQNCKFYEETEHNGTTILLNKDDVLQVTLYPSGVVQTDSYLGLVMLWLVQ